MTLRTRSRNDGFTLVELLIVIVILGVLSSIVLFTVGGLGSKGDTAACKAALKTVEGAEEANYTQFGAYASIASLISHKLLKEAPQSDAYTISVPDLTTGTVVATPACATLG